MVNQHLRLSAQFVVQECTKLAQLKKLKQRQKTPEACENKLWGFFASRHTKNRTKKTSQFVNFILGLLDTAFSLMKQ
jgi:hypothetical protein